MYPKQVSIILQRAQADADFRRRFLKDFGNALAEEGFLLSDDDMATLRGHWEGWHGLSERGAYERIMALARIYAGPNPE